MAGETSAAWQQAALDAALGVGNAGLIGGSILSFLVARLKHAEQG